MRKEMMIRPLLSVCLAAVAVAAEPNDAPQPPAADTPPPRAEGAALAEMHRLPAAFCDVMSHFSYGEGQESYMLLGDGYLLVESAYSVGPMAYCDYVVFEQDADTNGWKHTETITPQKKPERVVYREHKLSFLDKDGNPVPLVTESGEMTELELKTPEGITLDAARADEPPQELAAAHGDRVNSRYYRLNEEWWLAEDEAAPNLEFPTTRRTYTAYHLADGEWRAVDSACRDYRYDRRDAPYRAVADADMKRLTFYTRTGENDTMRPLNLAPNEQDMPLDDAHAVSAPQGSDRLPAADGSVRWFTPAEGLWLREAAAFSAEDGAYVRSVVYDAYRQSDDGTLTELGRLLHSGSDPWMAPSAVRAEEDKLLFLTPSGTPIPQVGIRLKKVKR